MSRRYVGKDFNFKINPHYFEGYNWDLKALVQVKKVLRAMPGNSLAMPDIQICENAFQILGIVDCFI